MGFEWILQVPILFFSIIIHEFSHGLVALFYGDHTAEEQGRLTLNPLPHVDLFGTLLLPAMCILGGAPVFGWAKPVPVDSSRMRGGKRAIVAVSLVGPLSNVALAFLAALLFRLSYTLGGAAPDMQDTLAEALRFGVVLNLYLAAFNLIPVHPLDGSKVLEGLLPKRLARQYEQHAPYGFLIILFLIMSGTLSHILFPMVRLGIKTLAMMGLFW